MMTAVCAHNSEVINQTVKRYYSQYGYLEVQLCSRIEKQNEIKINEKKKTKKNSSNKND